MTVTLSSRSLSEWRARALNLLHRNIDPKSVSFVEKNSGELLWTEEPEAIPMVTSTVTVPKKFVELAKLVSHHRDPNKWNLLYDLLYRLTNGEKHLLEIDSDPSVNELRRYEKALRRDIHKMHAFVRFSDVEPNTMVAWYEPDHFIVELATPFFARRFPTFNWSIFTPHQSAHWNGSALQFGEGVPDGKFIASDNMHNLWRTYYRAVFNPARLKIGAMKKEMPVRFWKNLPEAQEIADLIGNQDGRVQAMLKTKKVSSWDFIPAEAHSLKALREALQDCEGCPLYEKATQAVFGEGNPQASILFVGEQPGDEEDKAGRPFIGPAGKLLDEVMAEAGIDRKSVYVTNAVKHFSWKPQGKRRLHQKPRDGEISACQGWLHSEIQIIKPKILVCLGGSAGRSIFGRLVRIQAERGRFMESPFCPQTLITYHPSAALRSLPEMRTQIREGLLEDLRLVAKNLPKAA